MFVASREAARYTDNGSPQEHCSICRFWTPGPTSTAEGQCHIVAGELKPQGWCIHFQHPGEAA